MKFYQVFQLNGKYITNGIGYESRNTYTSIAFFCDTCGSVWARNRKYKNDILKVNELSWQVIVNPCKECGDNANSMRLYNIPGSVINPFEPLKDQLDTFPDEILENELDIIITAIERNLNRIDLGD